MTSTSALDTTTATLLPVIPEQDSHPTNPLDASEPVPLTYTEPSNFTQEEAASAPVTESKHYDAGYVPRHLKRVLKDNKWTYEEDTESQDKDIYHDLSTFPDGTSS